MLNQKKMFVILAGVFFLLCVASGKAVAQIPASSLKANSQFRPIEQSLEVKLAVTLTGMSFIGLELWWFVFRKS